MSYLAKNNAYGQLASGISAGVTVMTLQAGQGDRFPVVANPDYTYVTLEDAAGNREIVKVTARSAASDVMTIVRAQEGTVARSWSAGDVVELRMTASLVETAMAHPVQTTGAHAASAIAVTPTGNLAASNVQAALAELDYEKEPAFVALGLAKGGTGGTTRNTALSSLGVEAAEAVVQTTANATTDIAAAASQNILLTTGATAITGFVAATAGVTRKIRMATGGVTLSPNATFIVPSGANIVTAAGDCFEAHYGGTAWIIRNYQKADGQAIVSPTKASIGLGNVDNTADANKSVNYAANAGLLGNNPPSAFAAAGHLHPGTYLPANKGISTFTEVGSEGFPAVRITLLDGTYFQANAYH